MTNELKIVSRKPTLFFQPVIDILRLWHHLLTPMCILIQTITFFALMKVPPLNQFGSIKTTIHPGWYIQIALFIPVAYLFAPAIRLHPLINAIVINRTPQKEVIEQRHTVFATLSHAGNDDFKHHMIFDYGSLYIGDKTIRFCGDRFIFLANYGAIDCFWHNIKHNHFQSCNLVLTFTLEKVDYHLEMELCQYWFKTMQKRMSNSMINETVMRIEHWRGE